MKGLLFLCNFTFMKALFHNLFFFISLFFLFISFPSFSQVNWNKYPSNPVLAKGPMNIDIIAVGQPTVLFENDTIKMWYIGAGNDMKGRICYAYSTDGIIWNISDSAVINVGGPGEWDRGWLDTPEIVRDPSGYKMYYYGDTLRQNAAINSAIGMAFSSDGIHWTKYSWNPVFTKGNTGDWDGSWVESPAIIYDDSGNEYKMWYNGIDTTTWKLQIGLATSPDGINWTRYPGNPVLTTSPWGQYDDIWLGTPAVLKENGVYKMLYSSTSTVSYDTVTHKFDTIGICYASSSDGINWTKDPGNPLFNNFTPPYDSLTESGGPWACDLVFDPNDNNYKMWYETSAGFCLVTSDIITGAYQSSTAEEDDIIFYPNPASDVIIFQNSNQNSSNIFSVELFSCDGNLIRNGNKVSSVSLDVSYIPAGLYFARIITNGKLINKKIEIIR